MKDDCLIALIKTDNPEQYTDIKKSLLIEWANISILAVGASVSGQSALVIRFIQDHFIEAYDPTLVDSYRTLISLYGGSLTCTLDILDVSSYQELVAQMHIRSNLVDAYLVSYRITSETSIKDAEERVREIMQENLERFGNPRNMPIILVATKSDLEIERKISCDDGVKLAKKYGFQFVETSAKQNTNVRAAFESLAETGLRGKIIRNFDLILSNIEVSSLSIDLLFDMHVYALAASMKSRHFLKKIADLISQGNRLLILTDFIKRNHFDVAKEMVCFGGEWSAAALSIAKDNSSNKKFNKMIENSAPKKKVFRTDLAVAKGVHDMIKMFFIGNSIMQEEVVYWACLGHRYNRYDTIIEESFHKEYQYQGQTISLDMTITASQEEYAVMRDQYFKTADVLIYCFTPRPESFEVAMFNSIERAKDRSINEINVVLAYEDSLEYEYGTETFERAQKFAKENSIQLCRFDKCTGEGVDNIIQSAVEVMLRQTKPQGSKHTPGNRSHPAVLGHNFLRRFALSGRAQASSSQKSDAPKKETHEEVISSDPKTSNSPTNFIQKKYELSLEFVGADIATRCSMLKRLGEKRYWLPYTHVSVKIVVEDSGFGPIYEFRFDSPFDSDQSFVLYAYTEEEGNNQSAVLLCANELIFIQAYENDNLDAELFKRLKRNKVKAFRAGDTEWDPDSYIIKPTFLQQIKHNAYARIHHHYATGVERIGPREDPNSAVTVMDALTMDPIDFFSIVLDKWVKYSGITESSSENVFVNFIKSAFSESLCADVVSSSDVTDESSESSVEDDSESAEEMVVDQSPTALFEKAQALFQSGDRVMAAEKLFEYLKLDSQKIEAYQKAYQLVSQFNSLSLIQKLSSNYLNEEDVRDIINHVNANISAYINEYNNIIEILTCFFINSAMSMMTIGEIYALKEDYTNAINFYSLSIDKLKDVTKLSDETRSFLYQEIGIAYYKLKQYDSAFENFKRSFELNPNSDKAIEYIIKMHTDMGSFNLGACRLEQLLNGQGNVNVAKLEVGFANLKMITLLTNIDNQESLSSRLQSLMSMEPYKRLSNIYEKHETISHLLVGRRLINQLEDKLSNAEYEMISDISMTDVCELFLRGLLHELRSNKEQAISDYEKIGRINKHFTLSSEAINRLKKAPITSSTLVTSNNQEQDLIGICKIISRQLIKKGAFKTDDNESIVKKLHFILSIPTMSQILVQYVSTATAKIKLATNIVNKLAEEDFFESAPVELAIFDWDTAEIYIQEQVEQLGLSQNTFDPLAIIVDHSRELARDKRGQSSFFASTPLIRPDELDKIPKSNVRSSKESSSNSFWKVAGLKDQDLIAKLKEKDHDSDDSESDDGKYHDFSKK